MKTANIKAAVLSATLLGLVLPGMAEEEKRTAESPRAELGNELVDVRKFRISTDLALKDRARKRITESQFIEMSKDEQTMILDTRSAASFALLHVRGAVHLNFSEMTTGSRARRRGFSSIVTTTSKMSQGKVAPHFRQRVRGWLLTYPLTLHFTRTGMRTSMNWVRSLMCGARGFRLRVTKFHLPRFLSPRPNFNHN